MTVNNPEGRTFPHRTRHQDLLLQSFERRFGNDGYAFYFKMQELLFRKPPYEIQIENNSFTLLADMVGVSEELFLEMLEHALNQGFFDNKTFKKRDVLTSHSIKESIFTVPDYAKERMETNHYYHRQAHANRFLMHREMTQAKGRNQTELEDRQAFFQANQSNEAESPHPSKVQAVCQFFSTQGSKLQGMAQQLNQKRKDHRIKKRMKRLEKQNLLPKVDTELEKRVEAEWEKEVEQERQQEEKAVRQTPAPVRRYQRRPNLIKRFLNFFVSEEELEVEELEDEKQ